MTTYREDLHDIVRSNVLCGNLSTMPQRLYFHHNINNFLRLNIYSNRRSAKRILRSQYRKLYQLLILDYRFEFRIISIDNIGIYATEDIQNVGEGIFVGAFTRQLSQNAAQSHCSCVVRQLSQISTNNSYSRLSQHWILTGSIALLNHAHNHCSQLLPYNSLAVDQAAHLYSSFRVISQVRTILNGEQICISYTDNDSDIFYICSICN
jgi:hypothetical protein